MELGKLEKRRGQPSTRGQPGLWDRGCRCLLVQAETRKKDRKPPGITLPCYKLKRKQVVVGDGSHPHPDRDPSVLPSCILKTPNLSPSTQALRDYGGAELTSGFYNFREVTLGIWKSCVSSELVEL